MANLPIPASGYTTQGQQTSNLMGTFSGTPVISPVTPSADDTLQKDQAKVQGTASSMATQYPTWARGVQSNLQTQAGIPQLEAGQVDLAKIFPLYLHDQMLAEKYANPAIADIKPTTMAQYLEGDPNVLLGNVIPKGTFPASTSDAGFTGFTTPSAVTSAMTEVPNVASTLIDALSKVIGFEQSNIVQPGMQTASESYQASLNTLGNLIQAISSERDRQFQWALASLKEKNKAGSQSQRKLVTQFNSSIKDGATKLRQGESWGTVWNRIRSQFDPSEVSDEEIDNALGAEWKTPGAYQDYIFNKKAAAASAQNTLSQNPNATQPSDTSTSTDAQGGIDIGSIIHQLTGGRL